MPVSTVTSKGQTTIPKDVRDAAGLSPGVRVQYTVLADGSVILRARNRGVRDLGVKPRSGRKVPTDQLNR